MLCFPDIAYTLVGQSLKGLAHAHAKSTYWDYVPASNGDKFREGWQTWLQSFYIGYMGALCLSYNDENCAMGGRMGRFFTLVKRFDNNWVGSSFCLIGQVSEEGWHSESEHKGRCSRLGHVGRCSTMLFCGILLLQFAIDPTANRDHQCLPALIWAIVPS
jgi:hypothetical protein